MDNSCGPDPFWKNQERGASRLKFVLIMAVIVVVAYVGYQYVPVAYQASRFKIVMQEDVDKASTLGQTSEWLRNQLRVDGNEFSIPATANITVEQSADGRAKARVVYTRDIVLPGYTYIYKFDYTATSTELLGKPK